MTPHRLRSRVARDRFCSSITVALLGISILVSASPAAGQAPNNRAAAEQSTLSLINLHRQFQSASANGQQALALELHSVAAKRQQLLSSLMQSNPGEVLRVAIPPEIRNGMPESVRTMIEQHVTLQGQVQVAIEDGANYSRIHYGLIVAGTRLELHFAGKAPTNWLTDMNARISGVRIGNDVALTLNDTSVTE